MRLEFSLNNKIIYNQIIGSRHDSVLCVDILYLLGTIAINYY